MKSATVGHTVFTWRLLRVGIHIVSGLVQMLFLFGWIAEEKRKRKICLWSKQLLTICAVRTEVYGQPPNGNNGKMLVANHISWLDIFALNSCEAMRFVAKTEIDRWFLIGYLSRRAGTVFIKRDKRSSIPSTLKHISNLLDSGELVVIFPEGTTGTGETVQAFKSSLLQAATISEYPLQPVAVRYPMLDGTCNTDMAYCGETSLWQSLCKVLRGRNNVVELYFLPALTAQTFSRNQLAEIARQQITGCLTVCATSQRYIFDSWQCGSEIAIGKLS